MSGTLAIDGCHELCLLHLSDLNSIRHALIEFRDRLPHGLNVRFSAGQQILVSSDLTSQCLGLTVTHKQRHHLIDH